MSKIHIYLCEGKKSAASTTERVELNTSSEVHREMDDGLQVNISCFLNADRDTIDQRLEELDREWNVERFIETEAPLMNGLTLARTVNKRWYAMAGGVPAFMVQHALQGWCPPLAALRRIGFRTSKVINEERFALKAMRGDFDEAARSRDIDPILRAVRNQGRSS